MSAKRSRRSRRRTDKAETGLRPSGGGSWEMPSRRRKHVPYGPGEAPQVPEFRSHSSSVRKSNWMKQRMRVLDPVCKKKIERNVSVLIS
ncbi:hypothetical protein SKAU_G00284660 [Synaphobranchus kaupii]|uniref:Uncharacterized protein n=1 Tax=Synaphobranchus kaupii TaxID=118154 RepID=A0A9Q1IPA6_SYNKA|nr:hypothetical protein SKAU_G00284660 [Synaphobranchus kaupii]